MSRIVVSGLVNTETTVKVRKFPIEYYPIDYHFFGVNTRVSGVAYNLAKALTTLGDDVAFVTMTGQDFGASYINNEIKEKGISTEYVRPILRETPSSVVLYDEEGKRQIYCDLKDIQETSLEIDREVYADCDIVILCNINFNREILKKVRAEGKLIATDVHVLSDINDEYNRDFMENANILFLSDEGIKADYREFVLSIEEKYGNDIIVLGMGSKGALMYEKKSAKFYELPAVTTGKVVNTVGAGDSLFSAFIHYYSKGINAVEALTRAEIFASYKIGFDGASNGFASEEIVDKYYQKFKEVL